MIVGLTKDEGKSFLGRLCRSKLVQFLGHYSMATYMLHDSVEKIIILHVELEQVKLFISCLKTRRSILGSDGMTQSDCSLSAL